MCNFKSGEIKQTNSYNDLIGITKSLLVDSNSFILHFRKRSSIEMASEVRDEILDVIQQIYWLKFNSKNQNAPVLKMYGVSSKSLANFVTSEKDILRHIDRMPTEYYLIGSEKASDSDLKKSATLDAEFDAELDDYFEFVLIEKDEA
jgi:hypothetical protein